MKRTFLRWVGIVAVLALLASMLPVGVLAEGGSAIGNPERIRGVEAFDSRLQPVPEEVVERFAGGIPVEEFVAMAGYVPRALEGIVDKEVLVIIELEQEPAALLYARQKAQAKDGPVAMGEITAYQRALKIAQDQVMQAAAPLGAREISRYTTVYNGIQALVPVKSIPEIAALPGVKAVHRAPVHEPALAASVPLIGAPGVWEDFGFQGEGIVIAIIDTGIDYTHAALGGSGNPADYALNNPNVVEPGTFPTAKMIGGYDFAGTDYDASGETGSPIPSPDPDPLDENGHGTHVASTAAGIMAGSVMTGTAPAAQLLALKVFGKSGSTTLTMDALEWATISYMMYGYPQVINMSLGSPFGTDDPNDPDIWASNNAAAVGIIVVASAGNNGNVEYITGSPGVASKVLSVAATTTGYVTGPSVSVVDSPYITQTNIIYTPPAFDGDTGHFTQTLTATLAYVGNLAGASNNLLCSTSGIAPNALMGKVALIQRGSCAFSTKVNNAASLGAIAALIYNNTTGIITMAGSPVPIPAASLQQQDGLNLIPADGELVLITAEDEVITVPDPYTPADTVATFSSRGPRGYDSALKPEVAAPGVAIFAADMGTGTGGTSMSGTSMAAPHVAGVAALVKQAHPEWTPEQVKAAIMNTVVPLLDDTVGNPRTGSGRVDAYAAVSTPLLAIGDPDLVSLNWGVVTTSTDTLVLTGTITLQAVDWFEAAGQAPTMDFVASVEMHPSSMVDGLIDASVNPSVISLMPGESQVVTVTMELDMTAVPQDYALAEEYFGWVVFTPNLIPMGEVSASQVMPYAVVPFYFQPKPYAALEIVADGEITHPMVDYATITMTHTGPVGSSLWAYPALVAAEEPNPSVQEMASVRLFGMDYGWTHPPYGDILALAIDAWGPWHVPQPYFAEFDLWFDADEDGSWDYVNFNFNYGWLLGGGDTNLWIVAQVDLSSWKIYLGSPWTIWTDFSNSLMEWYLPAGWNDLGPGNSDVTYQLVGWDAYGNPDVTPVGAYDYAKFPFFWDYTGDPSPTEPEQFMIAAIGSMSGYHLAQPHGLMIVDYIGDPHNQEGGQAYLVPIEVELWYLRTLPLIMGGNKPVDAGG